MCSRLTLSLPWFDWNLSSRSSVPDLHLFRITDIGEVMAVCIPRASADTLKTVYVWSERRNLIMDEHADDPP